MKQTDRQMNLTFEMGDGDVVAGFRMSLIRSGFEPFMSFVFVFLDAFALSCKTMRCVI